MIFNETIISGLIEILPEEYLDQRGSFFRTYCKKEFEDNGLIKEFVQMNHSINSKKGTFRGFHYQIGPNRDCKLIRCIAGSALDILVDLRRNSETFLKNVQIEISEENKKLLYVPEGVAHGFITLKGNTQLLYNHTAYYNPEFEGSVNFKDPLIGIKLPMEPEVISYKDASTPFLTQDFCGI
ncbi:dTDP-4-dehydrorhamnose 3,5-epimerase [Lutimonas saemankumensis]|uniref:dTDP-4-dehydrorhamnose 3,5-epimerase n=1 Tax=Lutimonas saemankumensis TaxID=483016 RepID=UPI001CD56EB5|nr:dTDP-4-dehydrorhamnose 3,5-epimerase [Lutimonas saemankumensis]MCA0931051.1 dTDP-4-dehydrorhamnose 3,5-epimerase [Lutimonas saemankumensis]